VANLDSKIQSLKDAILTLWDNHLKSDAPPDYQDYAMDIPSSTAANIYIWMAALVEITRWTGRMVWGNLKAFKATVINDLFTGGFKITISDIEDDNLGMVKTQVTGLMSQAQRFWGKLLHKFIAGIFTVECYDGQYFIDTDHPSLNEDGTTVSNKGTKKFQESAVLDALQYFDTVMSPSNEPLDMDPVVVMVGPKYYELARRFYNDTYRPGSSGTEDNPLKGRLKPVKNKWLVGSAAEYWFIFAKSTDGALKPFAVQTRVSPQLQTSKIGTGSDLPGAEAVDEKQLEEEAVAVKSRQRGEVTCTLWPLAWGSDGTVA
jgi:phage major head subunit gpT-like protein